MIPRGRLKRHARLVRRSKAVRRQPWSHLGDRHAHVRELDRNWGSQLLTGGARREKKGSLTPLITEVDWSPLCGEKTARWVLRVTRGDAGITGDISTRTRLGALGRGIIRQIHVTQDGLSEFPRSA